MIIPGCVLFCIAFIACYCYFGKPLPDKHPRGNSSPVTPVREMQQMPSSAPDHTGDLASRSNGANRDTDLPIEVKATLNGTLQRPQ